MYSLCPASTIAALSSVYGFFSCPLGVASTRSAGFMALAGAGGAAAGGSGGCVLGSSALSTGTASSTRQLRSRHFGKTQPLRRLMPAVRRRGCARSARRRGRLLEQLHHRLMILRPRDRQRRLTGLAAGVDVRTRLDQQRDELRLVGGRRDHERRDAALVARIYVRPALEEHLGGSFGTLDDGEHE